MSNVPKVWWDGRSGARYTFELHPIGTEFNPLPGVYVFAKLVPLPSGANFFEALYVGETESFVDRLNSGAINHDGYKRALASKATHVAALICKDRTERLRVETDLRHGLNPVCNAQPVPTLADLFSLKG